MTVQTAGPLGHATSDPVVAAPVTPDAAADVHESVLRVCDQAKRASRVLRTATRAAKDRALYAIADALVAASDRILAANAADLATGAEQGLSTSLRDRLRLDEARIVAMAAAVREIAALPDPVGEVVRGSTLPNGLRLRQVRVPMGVVGMIYEARPNVTVDAACLALKSGNAAVLRGGSAALGSNEVLVDVLRRAVADSGLPADAVATIDPWGREGARHLMRARGLVDVLVPRGGADLIRTVVQESTVPVIETGVGNCHVYVDASADPAMALAIVLNAKTSRPSVCNAAETVLVHAAAADTFLPVLLPAFTAAGVTVHGDHATQQAAQRLDVPVVPATDDDWGREYLSLDCAVGVVADLPGALEHIRRWGTGHTEAIVTRDLRASEAFVAGVDAAAVVVNASTRFTDGGQFGLGAEVGISTQKLHARGPMGLAELTTTTWLVHGDGQIRT